MHLIDMNVLCGAWPGMVQISARMAAINAASRRRKQWSYIVVRIEVVS